MCTAVDMKKEKSECTTQNTRVSPNSVSLNIQKNGDVSAEQRCTIKFCVRLKKKPSETRALLKEAFGKETGDLTIQQWHKAFVDR